MSIKILVRLHCERQNLLKPLLLALFLMLFANPVESSSQSISDKIEGASAHWVDFNTFLWKVPDNAVTFKLHYDQEGKLQYDNGRIVGGVELELDARSTGWRDSKDVFRTIRDWPQFFLRANRQHIRDALRSQVLAAAYGSDGELVQLTHVQTHGILDALFAYEGPLGVMYTREENAINEISLRLWAPTVQNIRLRLYDADKNLVATVAPVFSGPGEEGVWVFKGDSSWDRLYYRFLIQVYHYSDNRIHVYEVTDPYSVSLSTDSRFSQIVDLQDSDLKPEGWDDLIKALPHPNDISVYEAHIRDFSVWDFTVPENHRGTYMAFTHNGLKGRSMSDGMAHLKSLADAGLTHLHLLPINDITTVREDRRSRVDVHDLVERICEVMNQSRFVSLCEEYGGMSIAEVFELWAEEDPATERIQELYLRIGHHTSSDRVDGLASFDGFNWGYDPWHFNAPEGSYATDAEGVKRIRELREMVMALYEIGLLTVVDVVYNHTSAAGLSDRSVLDRVVPGYYMRRDPVSGSIETSTCCWNTASEFYMMEKLMVDSILLWAREYKIDSFRFDLMGHHPVYVMERIRDELARLTPEADGMDGAGIYLYGEGWNFGEVADDRIFVNATQQNTAGTGIGNFNDRNRDAIRGGMFSDWGRNQGFTSGQYLFPNEEAMPNKDGSENARDSGSKATDLTGTSISANYETPEQLERLLEYTDRIKVGLAGNLKTYIYENRFGDRVTGGNEGIGYTLHPQENVNYIDKHDNETLWDNTQPKLPYHMSTWDRVYIHTLSQAIINFSQGIPFHQMGSDILRSKSLDRNSYDSGDWFNRVDFSLSSHNWARGLPPAWDNRRRWDDIKTHFANPNIQVQAEHMKWSHEVFKNQLSIRYSTPLLRLRSAEDIHQRVTFHNNGPNQVPGLIVMSISDMVGCDILLDEDINGVLLLFNARSEPYFYNVNLRVFDLHPVQKDGADKRVRDLVPDERGIEIPAHGYVVLVLPTGRAHDLFKCRTALNH